MDISSILAELRTERDRIQAAIDALDNVQGARAHRRGRRPGHHMSADARRRIGLAMKKRWAERKKAEKKAA
jgi:hypothetical protein